LRFRQDRLSPSVCRELPALVEEAGFDHGARRAGGRGRVEVEHGVVGQLGHLTGVVEVVVLAVGEPAVDTTYRFGLSGLG